MNKTKLILGTGFIVLVVLATFLVSAVPAVNAAATAYFVPEDGSAATGDTTAVNTYLEIDADETLLSGQLQIQFDVSIANVTDVYLLCQYVNPTGPDEYCWHTHAANFNSEPNGYIWGTMSVPQESKYYNPPGPDPLGWYYVDTEDGLIHGPATVPTGTYEVKASGTPGVSPFDFGFEYKPDECPLCQPCKFANGSYYPIEITWENGTFTHIGEPETFEKPLVQGWNLISLPLTPEDNSTSAVLGNNTIGYDAVYRYNAETKLFESVMNGTMDPGIGYFVNVTAAGTWSYNGTPYTPMSIGLKQGLNMVGGLNCSKQISGNLTSIAGKYNYLARWNATSSKYGVYEPHAPEVFNDFFDMKRGEGYWIAAKEGCTLAGSC